MKMCTLLRIFLILSPCFLVVANEDEFDPINENNNDLEPDACFAAIEGNVELGRQILANHSTVHLGQCKFGEIVNGTPLQAAAYYRRKDYIDLLLDQPGVSEQMTENEKGSGSPLHAMALLANQNDEIDEEIFTKLHSANKLAIESSDREGRTPFLVAVKASSLKFAKILLKNGANITKQDDCGYSALHLANSLEMMEFLFTVITQDHDVKTTNDDHLTPLQIAVIEKKSTSVIKFLLAQKSTLNPWVIDKQGRSIAHIAVHDNNEELLDLLLIEDETKRLFGIKDKEGRTPLLLAIQLGFVDLGKKIVAKLPLERLRDKTATTDDTAIHLAINHPLSGLVSTLLARDNTLADLTNLKLQTVLHLAVSRQSLPFFKPLIELMRSEKNSELVRKQDIKGRTPLHLMALRCGSPISLEIGNLFTKQHYIAVQDVADSFGETPLEIAVKHNCIDTVNLFLSNDACCSTQNRHGYTPLHLARRYGFDLLFNEMLESTNRCNLDQLDACDTTVRQINETDPIIKVDRCDPLPLIENGDLIIGQENPLCIGTKVQFNCKKTAIQHGSNVIECNQDGKWLIRGYCKDSQIFAMKRGEFFKACNKGNGEKVRTLLLTEGFDVDTIFSNLTDGANCLILAVQNGKIDLVKMLLREFKAKVGNHFASDGDTALHLAAKLGNFETVRTLFENGHLNLAAKNYRGETSLIVAAKNGHSAIVEYLLQQDASVINDRDATGKTALDLTNEDDVKELLKKQGALETIECN